MLHDTCNCWSSHAVECPIFCNDSIFSGQSIEKVWPQIRFAATDIRLRPVPEVSPEFSSVSGMQKRSRSCPKNLLSFTLPLFLFFPPPTPRLPTSPVLPLSPWHTHTHPSRAYTYHTVLPNYVHTHTHTITYQQH